MNIHTQSLVFLLLLFFTTLPAQAQDAQQCKTWSEQHQNLRQLRRAGGSVKEMDEWRDKQRHLEKLMRGARCLQRFSIGY